MTVLPYETLRRALAKHRMAAGLTQADLAERLKRSRQFVSQYESGRRRLFIDEFVQVTRCLELNPGRLLRMLMGAQHNGHISRRRVVGPEE